MVLRYSRALAWFGAAFVAFGVGVGVVFWVVQPADFGTPAGLLAVFVVLCLPGLAFIAVQRRECVRVGLDGLEAHGAFGRVHRLRWAEVERVTFGATMSALTFHGPDGSKLRASAYYVGVIALADMVERRLPSRGGVQAVRQLRAFRGSWGDVSKR